MQMGYFLKKRKILITGGSGSLGMALADILVRCGADKVIIYSKNGDKNEAMRRRFPIFEYITGDIRDFDLLKKACENIDYVIHAAALKDVHICEKNPLEAIDINVNGTVKLLDAAQINNVNKVIVVSSDKAVYPSGVMGITKAMMEKIATAHNAPGIIIRPGNLMGSTGTVVPLFIKQVKEGKNLTVTNPEMTRFLMTPESAAEYLLFALEHGQPKSLVLQKAPAYSIGMLASAIIDLYSQDPLHRKESITVIGSRPGEKLYETMITEEEISRSVLLNNLHLQVSTEAKNFSDNLKTAEEYNSHNAPRIQIDTLKKIITDISSKNI